MLALLVTLVNLTALPQQPASVLPVSLDRVREELKKPPPAIDPDRPLEQPVATFRMVIEQPRFVPTIHEWIAREFTVTALQRQSAEWGEKCCGMNLISLWKGVARVRRRSEEARIRREVAQVVAELEARKKTSTK